MKCQLALHRKTCVNMYFFVHIFLMAVFITSVSSEFIILFYINFIFRGLRVSPVTNRSPLTPGSHRAEVRHSPERSLRAVLASHWSVVPSLASDWWIVM